MQTAQTLGEQLLSLAQHTQDPAMLLAAHRALGTTLFYLGVVAAAHTHLTQGIALYDLSSTAPRRSSMGRTLGWCCPAVARMCSVVLGYPDQGLARSQEALTLAQQSGAPL